MERAIALQSLTREHALDRKTCDQLKNAIRDGQDKKNIRNGLLSFWQNDLQKHIDAEEKQLLPFLARHHFDHQFLSLLQRDHTTIRTLAQRLPMHDDGYYLYEVFIDLVQQHLLFMDDVILYKAVNDIPAPELEQLRIA